MSYSKQGTISPTYKDKPRNSLFLNTHGFKYGLLCSVSASALMFFNPPISVLSVDYCYILLCNRFMLRIALYWPIPATYCFVIDFHLLHSRDGHYLTVMASPGTLAPKMVFKNSGSILTPESRYVSFDTPVAI